ncbi:hypothetical protein ACLB2K_072022 [Fragaria x ananassa]
MKYFNQPNHCLISFSQGLSRRFKRNGKRIDLLLETIIQDHEQASKTEMRSGQRGHDHDFVDMLLSLMNQPLNFDGQVHLMDRTNMKAILFDLIVASVHTSAVMVVWIFSELMRHPRVMKNLQQELDSVIGKDRMVQEVTDLPKLGYLNMVVKETFRLHPAGPLLVPHESINDTTVQGFKIAKKSRILFNVWSIGRDPKLWSENVEEFYPERFLDSKIDLQGHDFELIPFGSGRRGCPGMKLGLTTVQLVVAHLVHCFDWELPGGLQPQDLDMSEKFEMSLEKAVHVLAKPTYRLHT